MGEDGWSVTLLIFVLGLIWKAAHSHFKLREVTKDNEENKKHVSELQTEQIKIKEALERTYATEKFVYAVFITREEHTRSMGHLEDKLLSEMTHINNTLQEIKDIIKVRAHQ